MSVISLNGGPSFQREVNERAVELLEDFLERARSGDIVGVALCALCYDTKASWAIAGKVGGLDMVGGLEAAKFHALHVAMGGDYE